MKFRRAIAAALILALSPTSAWPRICCNCSRHPVDGSPYQGTFCTSSFSSCSQLCGGTEIEDSAPVSNNSPAARYERLEFTDEELEVLGEGIKATVYLGGLLLKGIGKGLGGIYGSLKEGHERRKAERAAAQNQWRLDADAAAARASAQMHQRLAERLKGIETAFSKALHPVACADMWSRRAAAAQDPEESALLAGRVFNAKDGQGSCVPSGSWKVPEVKPEQFVRAFSPEEKRRMEAVREILPKLAPAAKKTQERFEQHDDLVQQRDALKEEIANAKQALPPPKAAAPGAPAAPPAEPDFLKLANERLARAEKAVARSQQELDASRSELEGLERQIASAEQAPPAKGRR